MSNYQAKSTLDYTKVQQTFNKLKGKKGQGKNITSLKANLKNLLESFNKLDDDKKQEELKSEKFQQLFKDIDSLGNSEFSKIINSMEEQRELSEYENLSKQIEVLNKKLDNIEKENSQSQEDIAEMVQSKKEINKISKVINDSFWNTLKDKVPKLDLSPITQKIDSIKNELKQNKNDINNLNRELAKKIENIKPPTFPKIPTDYLKKDDFEFTIDDKLKDLKEIKESSENLETIPAKVNSIEKKINDLSKKLENLPSSNGSQTPKHIPKEEKSVIELAKYMTDGVAQFENIAKEYISKIGELEKLDKMKLEHQKELEKVKKDVFEKGKESGKIELIKNLAENFPTEFKAIQSTFEDLLEEKFKKDETLEIDDENINDMRSFIEENIENGKYKVVSPAILLDNKILFKANVEKAE